MSMWKEANSLLNQLFDFEGTDFNCSFVHKRIMASCKHYESGLVIQLKLNWISRSKRLKKKVHACGSPWLHWEDFSPRRLSEHIWKPSLCHFHCRAPVLKKKTQMLFQIESYFCHEHSTNYKKEKVIKVLTDKIYQKLDIHVRFSGPVFKEVRKLTEGEETSENPLSI